jgi:two-component system, OmpR family, response regulator
MCNPPAGRHAGREQTVTFIDPFEMQEHSAAARVLVVEDDPTMQRMIVTYLTDHNLRAAPIAGRRALLQAVAAREPDLVILDVHLGGDDGLDILRELRRTSVVPVILITGSRREEIDRVLGLELGADDYLVKPFGLRELLARIRAAIRRRAMDRLSPARSPERRYRFAGWSFDQGERALRSPAGTHVPLTKSEFALLSAFVDAPRRTLSRERLLQATRVHEDVFDRSIDVQVLRLRRKLQAEPGAPQLIRTERGAGYRFDADVEFG